MTGHRFFDYKANYNCGRKLLSVTKDVGVLFRSSRSHMIFKIDALKDFANFT